MFTKGYIRAYSLLICLTLLFSIVSIKPVEASRLVGAPSVPGTVYLPVGLTYTKTPTFSWRIVSGATYYRLNVYRKSDNQYIVHNLDVNTSSACKNNYCKVTPIVFDNNMIYGTEYKWKIAAGNESGLSGFSAFQYFTVQKGINSTFNTTDEGWLPKTGTWTLPGDGS
jgi:hypothetical protein